jgi:hypothetical protein
MASLSDAQKQYLVEIEKRVPKCIKIEDLQENDGKLLLFMLYVGHVCDTIYDHFNPSSKPSSCSYKMLYPSSEGKATEKKQYALSTLYPNFKKTYIRLVFETPPCKLSWTEKFLYDDVLAVQQLYMNNILKFTDTGHFDLEQTLSAEIDNVGKVIHDAWAYNKTHKTFTGPGPVQQQMPNDTSELVEYQHLTMEWTKEKDFNQFMGICYAFERCNSYMEGFKGLCDKLESLRPPTMGGAGKKSRARGLLNSRSANRRTRKVSKTKRSAKKQRTLRKKT